MNSIKAPSRLPLPVPFLEPLSLPEASVVPQRAPRRTADILIDVLLDHGVEVVFGIPGGTIAPIYDALLDHPEIRVVTTKHEGAAMFAAAGYALTSGKLGVVLVTSGPGAINALTGLASAHCDGLPVLLLAGEVPRKVYGRGALQEGSSYCLDILGMTRRISKLSTELHEPNAAASGMRRAIATAMSGKRGPVVLTLPVDVSSAMVMESEAAMSVSTSFGVDPAATKRAATLLATAQRPLIFVGGGVRAGSAPARLLALAEKLQIPVMTTPKGKGVFPEDHPLSLGVFGIGGHPSATRYLESGIDVILTIGSSLGDLSTNGWSPMLQARSAFIQVDVDSSQFGKNYQPTLAITAPAETFLRTLLEVSAASPEKAWFGVQHHLISHEPGNGPEGRITPQRALWEIQQVLPTDTIFASDVGEHSVFATHYLHTTKSDAFILMNGLGSMGQSIGAAMGAQLARPKRTVAAILGDGCLAMTCGEIATVATDNLPLKIFVFNDERLGMVELGHTAIYGRTPPYPLATIDVKGLAESLGATGYIARKAGDILALDLMSTQHRPVVVDVRIDRSIRMPRNGRFEALGTAMGKKMTEAQGNA